MSNKIAVTALLHVLIRVTFPRMDSDWLLKLTTCTRLSLL